MSEYTTADIANIVGIAKPTVNKYSRDLEKAGYRITRNEKGHRIYTDNDIEMLNRMKERSNELKMPTDKIAAMLITEQKHDTPIEEITIVNSTTLKQNEADNGNTLQIPNEFRGFFHHEFESMKESLREDLVQDFGTLLEEKFKVMERDRELTAIRQAQEVQKQIAAAVEPKKKGFWARLFRSE